MKTPSTEKISDRLDRLAKVASSLTQKQVDACAFVMGQAEFSWTPKRLSDWLKEEADNTRDDEKVEWN